MPGAYPDTRFLAEVTLTTDLSQRLTDLIPAAPGGYELASARTAIDGDGAGRSIEVECDIGIGTSGVLVHHGTLAAPRYALRLTVGIIEIVDSAGVLASTVAPSPPGSYIIAWSTEPNAASDGTPGTELRSTLLAYNKGTLELAKREVVHAPDATNPAETFTVGGIWDGAIMQQPYPLSIDSVRVSCRYHTTVETREHYLTPTPEPTPSGPVAVQLQPPPASSLEAGHIAGPGYQHAAASTRAGRDRHRLLGPVWQWISPAGVFMEYADDLRDVLRPSWVVDEGDGWQTAIHWLARRPLPMHAGHLRAILQVSTWKIAPLDPLDVVEWRLTCSTVRPGLGGERSSVVVSRTFDDGGGPGAGELLIFEPLPVRRAEDGRSWLWLSARTDGGSGAGNAGYAVRGLAVQPLTLGEVFDGGFPDPMGP